MTARFGTFLRGSCAAVIMAVAFSVMLLDGARSADLEPVRTRVKNVVEDVTKRCGYDLKTFCSSVTPGEGRLAFCLMAHANRRSSQCEYALFDARREAEKLVNQAIQSCQGDIASLCSGTVQGEGRIAQCLLDQKSSLSPSCGEVLDVVERIIFPASNAPLSTPPILAAAPAPAGMSIINQLDAKVQGIIEKGKQGCSEDLNKYCSSVTPGEGRLAFCLTAHADKRSMQCEKALAEARTEAEVLIDEVNQSVQACAPDITSLCSGTEPGEGRIAQCLLDQKEALSDACGAVLDKLGKVIFPARTPTTAAIVEPAAAESVAEPKTGDLGPAGQKPAVLMALESKVQSIIEKGKQGCAEDLNKYCSSVTPGEGRLAFCLIAHADKRSVQCDKTLAEARNEAEALIADVNKAIGACSPDIAALCSGTEPGEGRIAQCLADQKDVLSEACGQVLDTVGTIVFSPRHEPAPAALSAPSQITTGAVNSPAAATAPAEMCRTVEASVTDWGLDQTSRDARKLLKSQVGSIAAKNDLKQYTAGKGTVACSNNLNLLVAGYYTCRASTRVCWSPAGQSDATFEKDLNSER